MYREMYVVPLITIHSLIFQRPCELHCSIVLQRRKVLKENNYHLSFMKLPGENVVVVATGATQLALILVLVEKGSKIATRECSFVNAANKISPRESNRANVASLIDTKFSWHLDMVPNRKRCAESEPCVQTSGKIAYCNICERYAKCPDASEAYTLPNLGVTKTKSPAKLEEIVHFLSICRLESYSNLAYAIPDIQKRGDIYSHVLLR